MITIRLHPHFHIEKKYVLNVLLHHFLGIPLHFENHENHDTHLILPNGKIILLKDHFFQYLAEHQPIYQQQNLPKSITQWPNPFFPSLSLAVLYGQPVCQLASDTIKTEIDFIAGTFLMLTGWESLANPERDQHQRFLSRFSCLHELRLEPIVDQYTAFLRQLFHYAQYPLPTQSENGFAIKMTHDVDHIYFYKNRMHCLKKMVGDIILRKNWKLAQQRWQQYQRIARGHENDPYDTFDRLMDYAEAHESQALFFMMAGGASSQYDQRYSLTESRARQLITNIQQRGHEIALHSSYHSSENAALLAAEKNNLENAIRKEITQNRHHYLRFQLPESVRLWEANGIKMDYSGGYADRPGFRFGTGRAFPYFDVQQRKTLNLWEQPLLWMDAYAATNQFSLAQNQADLQHIIAIAKQLQIPCTLLFHNSGFHDYGSEMWKTLEHIFSN